jgi:uncharacterized protein involved in exopolysaccharide biosynthesis
MLKLLLGNPYVFGAIALAFVLMGAGLWVEDGLRAAAVKGEKAAVELAHLKSEDADRWHKASDLRDGTIDQLKSAYQTQTDRVNEGRAKEADLRARLDGATRVNRGLQDTADQLARDLAAEAEKAPGDVRPVGPIVARRAVALFQ